MTRRLRREAARSSRWTPWALAGLTAAVALAIVLTPGLRDELDERSHVLTAKALVNPTFSDVATINDNLAYCGSSDRHQTLDLYLPKVVPSRPVPLVVYIHGGGWRAGDKVNGLVRFYGPELVQRGYALAAIDYRLAPGSVFPAQNEDVSCALGYLQHNAARYGLDSGHITLFGDSAGGQLVAYAALSERYRSQPWRAAIRGVVDFYGVSDFRPLVSAIKPDHSARFYLGSNYLNLAAEASPVTGRPVAPPPFLIVYGVHDGVVPPAQSLLLAQHLRDSGGRVEVIRVDKAGHGFSARTAPTASDIRERVNGFVLSVE